MVKYSIKGPKGYTRALAGIVFVDGEGRTEDKWLAAWFSGREGFTVTEEAGEAEQPEAQPEAQPETRKKGRKKNDEGNTAAEGASLAAVDRDSNA